MTNAVETNYRWKRCYETCDGHKHWAIVSDQSEAERSVCSHLLVVEHEWADSTGRRFQDCELPQRIIALLNSDEKHFERAATKMRRYRSPSGGNPYSDNGMLDLEEQCAAASKAGDSALLEMAHLALRHWRIESRSLHAELTAKSAEIEKLRAVTNAAKAGLPVFDACCPIDDDETSYGDVERAIANLKEALAAIEPQEANDAN